jgi:hypothetical protein
MFDDIVRALGLKEKEQSAFKAISEIMIKQNKVILIPERQSCMAYMQKLNETVKSDLSGYGEVKASDGGRLTFSGRTVDKGFMPYVFSNHDFAKIVAPSFGWNNPDEPFITVEKNLVAALHDCLHE